MINNADIAAVVQDEIKQAIDRYVQNILADSQWQSAMEQQITDYVKDRITSRFQNIENIPGVKDEIQRNIQQMFAQGHIPGLGEFVDQSHIKTVIDSSVQCLISASLDQLIKDADWIHKIQQMVETNMSVRVSESLSTIDINSAIAQEVAANIQRWRGELGKNFSSTGIRDQATQCELLISDGAVVAQGGLACASLLAEQDISTKNLVVTETVNTDCAAWDELANTVARRTQDLLGHAWREELCRQILDLAKEQGIDFHDITVQGQPLVQGDRLNPAVISSSLKKVGVLDTLTVAGATHLAQTLDINNRRVGINTDAPDMALSVWDEEVSISIGKISRDHAWIGSNRNQTIDIGTNRRRAITIEPDGLVAIDRLRIDRWRIGFANSVPNHVGTRGDIMINHDPKPGSPFAWRCLGGFKWEPIGLA